MIGDVTNTTLLVIVSIALPMTGSSQMFDGEGAQGSQWYVYSVDTVDVVMMSSIALDANGYPRISYNKEGPCLEHAKWNGNIWELENVDCFGSVGEGSSIAIDSEGHAHISYYDWSYMGVRYAKWDGSSWNIETVDSGHVIGWTGLALDNGNNPHVVYPWHLPEGEVRYATQVGGQWNIEAVDVSGAGVGYGPSIALDSNDFPHVSYAMGDGLRLHYAKWNGSAWNTEIPDPSTHINSHSYISLALDSNDYPHISYQDNDNEDLMYARWDGGAWDIQTVESDGRAGAISSIAIDSNDNPHISYAWGDVYPSVSLHYAHWDGSSWTIETVDADGWVGRSSSIALDSNDIPHVSYEDMSNHELKYASKKPLRSLSLDIDPDTLNLKSMGKWITAYLTTTGVGAEDIDPSSLLLNDLIRPEWWDIQDETTLMVKFDRDAVEAIVQISNSVDIKVTGQWKDGESFELHDIIRVIDPGQSRVFAGFSYFRETYLSHFDKYHSACLPSIDRWRTLDFNPPPHSPPASLPKSRATPPFL
jgi:hypothetical protein